MSVWIYLKIHCFLDNNFSENTDNYAFGILLFKALTRIHPFGGTMNPEMDILERMEKGFSVIDNTNVTIPKTISKWSFMSPKLLEELKEIFNNNKRLLIDNTLEDYYNNLKFCYIDREYYYSKFDDCPLCNDNARLIEKPIRMINSEEVPYILVFSSENIKTIINQDTYIDKDNNIIHDKSDNKVPM